MNILLNLIISFYPVTFIYQSILRIYEKKLEGIAPSGFSYFLVHLVVFGLVFFVVYVGIKKLVSLHFASQSRKGILSNVLMVLFTFVLASIAFWDVLPGGLIFKAPLFIQKYILVSPFDLIWLVVPFIYFFFD